VDSIFVVLLVGCSSVIVYQAMRWDRERAAAQIRDAMYALLEWIGAFTVFFVANLALGVLAIFLIRTLTQRFIALYILESVLLWILSAAQAFIFQYCWKHR
jgi:hypothetical protein